LLSISSCLFLGLDADHHHQSLLFLAAGNVMDAHHTVAGAQTWQRVCNGESLLISGGCVHVERN
jgi:hypothetical protein